MYVRTPTGAVIPPSVCIPRHKIKEKFTENPIIAIKNN